METALLVFLSFLMEIIDAGLGMGYGTILSPLLLLLGFSPKIVVPAILISQASGGLMAAFAHNGYETANLVPYLNKNETTNKKTIHVPKDLKIAVFVGFFGVLASIIGASLGLKVPKEQLNLYIGTIITAVAIIMIIRQKFAFSWKKIGVVAIISSFNKGLSGGGFGPLLTGGQILAGNEPKKSVGSTTLAEAPICLAGFATYLAAGSFSDYGFALSLVIGASIGGFVGPYLTKTLNTKLLRSLITGIILIEGLLLLSKSIF